jgi:hypothetical protein
MLTSCGHQVQPHSPHQFGTRRPRRLVHPHGHDDPPRDEPLAVCLRHPQDDRARQNLRTTHHDSTVPMSQPATQAALAVSIGDVPVPGWSGEGPGRAVGGSTHLGAQLGDAGRMSDASTQRSSKFPVSLLPHRRRMANVVDNWIRTFSTVIDINKECDAPLGSYEETMETA